MAALEINLGERNVEKRSNASNVNCVPFLIRICRLSLLTLVLAASPALASTCESLSTLKLPDTTITSAQVVAAGAFELPSPAPNPAVFKEAPAFCRVTAELRPAKDSDIKIEVWMPVTGWNGKYQGVGNGGFAGSISYPALAGAVKAGYAAASTDTGHAAGGTNAAWA